MNAKYKVASGSNGAVFVRSNTKDINKLNQEDMKILFENGDPRILIDSNEQAEKTESVAEIIEAVSEFIKPAKPVSSKKAKTEALAPIAAETNEPAAITEGE